MPAKRKKFINEYDSNVGKIGIIEVSRLKNKPALPHPYEYFSRKNHHKFIKEINAYLSGQEAPEDGPGSGCQMASAGTKAVKYGYNLHVFVLAYEPGGTGDESGVTKKQWNEIVKTVQAKLHKFLGPDAEVYFEPWNNEHKFQLRFDTYVMNQNK